MLLLGMVWILMTYKATRIHCQGVNCNSGPCKNNALCEDTEAGFQCFCVDGFAGENCEINFDDCSCSPCRNNATCTDLVAGYTCTCSPGFTGEDCQINIDECTSNPCQPNGRCVDLVNGYVCECLPPFRGDNCTSLPCDNLPCENEAICRNDVGFNESLSGFVCDCITGFSGPRCEMNLEDCDLENFTSCSGNGLCVDGINDYSCLCEPGWVGDYCNFPVDDCIGNSCKNNATCTDLHLGYMCTCKTGYEGSLCERERDECSEWQPCENGAICVDLFNSYRCDCTDGWFGVNCSQEVNDCEINDCQNNAQCIDVIGGFKCRCPPFYTGLLCETQFYPCAPEYNPCQNNANCIVPPDGQYRCYCLPGYTGIHCEVNINECLSMPCENNSTCEDITAGYICHCTPGWHGQNCQDNIDDCLSEPCLNGADCLDLHNGFECNCTREYQGQTCHEEVDFCLRDPCFHDSTCISSIGGYRCLCSPPYTGEQCLDLIDACQSAPCVNNGTCMNTVSGFQCSCPIPFSGTTCDDRVDFCESSPCVVGTCVSLVDDFVCICPEYLTGKQCTDVVDYCQNAPCENYGNCINAEFDFRCICAYGFTGRTCVQMIDFCSEEPCQNEANCTNTPGSFQCICPHGFTGDLCQNELPAVISSTLSSSTSSFTDVRSSTLSIISFLTTSLPIFSTLLSTSVLYSITETLNYNTKLSASERETQFYSLSISPSSVIPHISETKSVTLPIDTPTTITYSSFSRTLPDSASKSETTLLTSFQPSSTGAIKISSSESFSPSIFSTAISSTTSSTMFSIEYSSASSAFDGTSSNMHSLSDMISNMHSSSEMISNMHSSSNVMSNMHSSSNVMSIMQSSSNVMSNMQSSSNVMSNMQSSSDMMIHSTSISDTPNSIGNAITTSSSENSFAASTLDATTSRTSSYADHSTLSSGTSIEPSERTKNFVSNTAMPSYSSFTLISVGSSISNEISRHSNILDTSAPLYRSTSNLLFTTSKDNTFPSIDFTHFPSLSSSGSSYSTTSATDTSYLSTTVSSSAILTSTTASSSEISPTQSSYSELSTLGSDYASSSFYIPSTIETSTNVKTRDSSELIQPSSTSTRVANISSMPMEGSTSSVSTQSETISTLSRIISKDSSYFQSEQSSSFMSTLHSSFTKSIESSEFSFLSCKSSSTLYQTSNGLTSIYINQTWTVTQSFDVSSSVILISSSMHTIDSLGSSKTYTSTSITLLPTTVIHHSTSESLPSSFMIPSILTTSLPLSTMHPSVDTHTMISSDYFGDTLTDFIMSSTTSSVSLLLQSSVSSGFSSVSETSKVFPSTRIISSNTITSYQSLPHSSEGTSLYTVESLVSSELSQQSSLSNVDTQSTSHIETARKSISGTFRSTTVLSHSQVTITIGTHSLIFPSLTEFYSSYSKEVSSVTKATPTSSSSKEIIASTKDTSNTLFTHLRTPEISIIRSLTGLTSSYSAYTDSLTETSMIILSTITHTSLLSLFTKSFLGSSETFSTSSALGIGTITSLSFIRSNSRTLINSVSSISSEPLEMHSSDISSYKSATFTRSGIVSTSAISQISPTRTLTTTSTLVDILSSTSTVPNSTSFLKFATLFKGSSTPFYVPSTTSIDGSSKSFYWSSTYVSELSTFVRMPSDSFYDSSKSIYSSSSSFYGLSTSIHVYVGSSALSSITSTSDTILSSKTFSSVLSSVLTTTTSNPSTSCDNFYCYNNGECREDISGVYCDCGIRYFGRQCQTEATACDGYVCENGGTCAVTMTVFNGQVPKCSCPLPFYGPRCENEKLIYYPAFIGSSYLELTPQDISSDQSNEIYVFIKTNQRDATILYSANQETDYEKASFIRLYLANGELQYSFSCDGVIKGVVETGMTVNTGDVYEIVVRQVWSSGPGEWCSSAVSVNSRVFISSPVLTMKRSQPVGKLYLGGIPRYTYQQDQISDTHIMEGFIGCIHNFQINKKEIDPVAMAIKGVNIDNCNVPVCQHDPCKNGATCHSSGEEWYCSCLPGYGGSLCERKLCEVNPCQHGGTCIIQEEARDQLCLCPYGRGGALCEQVLPVTIAHFIGNQYGYSSYIAYKHPHFVEGDLKLEFNIILDNTSSDTSLLFFMGNTGSYDDRRDFMVVGIEFGFVVYRFDLGSGYGQIYSARKLDETLQQHSIKLGRDGNMGWLQVDNHRNITGSSPGVLTSLNTNSKLYFGNIDVSEIAVLPDGADFDDGFKGCIFNIRIKSHITQFIEPGNPPGHVINGRNVGQCSSMSCDQNPCQNGANCRDIGASIYCVCNEGWKGTFCTDLITVCDLAHACGDGSTCVPDESDGYVCLCPLGKKGTYCKEAVNISDPMFLGEGSFMAFQPVYVKRKLNIKLQVKPNTSEGLLFYVAQRLHSHSGDFLAVTLNNKRVELKVDVGSGINNILNEAEIFDPDRWYSIEAGRNITHFYISVDGETISGQLQGLMTFLDITTDFFIGGLPNLEDASPEAFDDEPVAFRGCIREFMVNGKLYELDQNGAKYGRNIEDCDGSRCGYTVCKNGGTCTTQVDDVISCSCKGPFVGTACDIPMQCSNHSCVNGHCRIAGDDVYKCDCFIGWQGKFCDDVANLETSVEFSAESYVYFVDKDFRWSNASNTDISFVFKTSLFNCLIFWNGQTYTEDEDYLGVGIQDGRMKLVWNLGWYSRGEIITPMKYNDGELHTITIERKKQLLVLIVDGMTYESRVSGDYYTLDTFGEYYLGSFKESSGSVVQNTLGYFVASFIGCLRGLQIDNKPSVDFNSIEADGINILPCDTD